MLATALAAGDALMRSGVTPAAILLPTFAISALLVALLERWIPHEPAWNRSRGDLAADSTYLPLTWLVNGAIEPTVLALSVATGGWIAASAGLGLWPASGSPLLQLPLAAVVSEFFDYWAHRAMHEVPWLWRFHATHHSAPRLYWLNATRAHPGEMLFRGVIGMLPLALLGAGEEVLALAAIVNMVAGLYQHANVDARHGALYWIFSIGELHRWHHSRNPAEADTNYGNNYIFWDTVFGTRYLPADRKAPRELGIEGLDAFPRGFLGQVASPFRWSQIAARSARSFGRPSGGHPAEATSPPGSPAPTRALTPRNRARRRRSARSGRQAGRSGLSTSRSPGRRSRAARRASAAGSACPSGTRCGSRRSRR
jgi:sterol desaturase/sphingolipid hydroxylase (fatty acid hydroxylase superfamily)